MRYMTLATDYDGTLAQHGQVAASTVASLERLRASGRSALLVTGRHLEDLKAVFPRLDLFARVVAENGAVVYEPATREQVTLGDPPPPVFLERLRSLGVPVSTGRVVVATWEPHENTALQAIRELGLEHQVIFNKGAVMVLPPGVNKTSGLRCALDQLGLSPHNVVGVGDAENDHGFLAACECAVAVANALPFLKERADFVTAGDHGSGVEELIADLVRDDLRGLDVRLRRHDILVGRSAAGDFFRGEFDRSGRGRKRAGVAFGRQLDLHGEVSPGGPAPLSAGALGADKARFKISDAATAAQRGGTGFGFGGVSKSESHPRRM